MKLKYIGTYIKMINLNNIFVFDNIKEKSKSELYESVTKLEVKRKEVLFHEREIVDNVYFISKGKVSIYKINENGERKIIFILKEGDMINEVLLDNSKNTTFGCEVFEKSTILQCSSSKLIEIMEKDFSLTKNILLHTQNINRRLYRQLKNSMYLRLDKKLAAKLYRIAKEFGEENGQWTAINTNISITYIADMIGCKRESLSRAMKQLQEEDLVKIENKKIYIRKEKLSHYFKNN
ncbi:MAG: Crp/Fnr family transcriptional regulator [Peptostreptococcaceae bacterium]